MTTEQIEQQFVELVRHPLQIKTKVSLADDFSGFANTLDVQAKYDKLAQNVVFTFRGYMLRKYQEPQVLNMRTPRSWWQMFKRDIIPFVTRWFPLRYEDRRIEIQGTTYICPHLQTDTPAAHIDHIFTPQEQA